MSLPKNINTYLKGLPLKDMSGAEVFVAIAFFLLEGESDLEISVSDVKKHWRKTTIGKNYHSNYAARANGLIHPIAHGKFVLTNEGVSYIEQLMGVVPSHSTTLVVFEEGSAHSFDKFLREVFKNASTGVDIADTYVSGSLFDTLLDEIPVSVPIRFAYGSDTGGFVVRAKRFANQYKIKIGMSKMFHDRFLVVDGKGYIVGPSLKDAADKKPATVVVLNVADSKKAMALFERIWKKAK